MNQQKITAFYQDVMRAEKLPMVPIRFCRVGKGGACVTYNERKEPLMVQVDLNRCTDPEYAVLHEIAHVKLLQTIGYPGHDARFRKEENRLVDKYMYSAISMKHFA
jgi:hypothetical protein